MTKYRTLENKIRDMYERKVSDDSDEDAPYTDRGNTVTAKEPTMCGPNPSPVLASDKTDKIKKARGENYHKVSEANTIRSIINKNK